MQFMCLDFTGKITPIGLYCAGRKFDKNTKFCYNCDMKLKKLWQKYWLPHELVMPWPVGWIKIHEDGSGGITEKHSSDPNDFYRPWLEQHAGKQGWAWDWDYTFVTYESKPNSQYDPGLLIKFRRHKDAVFFALTHVK